MTVTTSRGVVEVSTEEGIRFLVAEEIRVGVRNYLSSKYVSMYLPESRDMTWHPLHSAARELYIELMSGRIPLH